MADAYAGDALLVAELTGECALLGAYQRPGRSGAAVELRGFCGGRSAWAGEGAVLLWAVLSDLRAWSGEPGAAQLSGPRVLNRLARGVLAGLTQIGVSASYPGRDFVAAGGRRVAQLSLARGARGALAFQAVVGCARSAATAEPPPEFPGLPPLPEAAALDVDAQRLCSALAEGFARRFGLELAPAELGADELRAIAAAPLPPLEEPELAGLRSGGAVATPIGELEAHVAVRADGSLERVRLRGDFIAARPALRELEQALVGHAPGAAATRERCARWLAAPESLVVGITGAEQVAAALERSARAAR